jgi:hypothetical protein
MHIEHNCRWVNRIKAIIPIALAASLILGCRAILLASPSATSKTTDTPETVSNPLAGSESGFAGVWEGSTLADCGGLSPFPSRCNAEQKVTITLLQGPNSKITGRYTCAYGNMDCYHANDTGRVVGATIDGRRMSVRVIMPDATSCIFAGLNLEQTINGGYSCYQGGALIEQGSWRAQRSY